MDGKKLGTLMGILVGRKDFVGLVDGGKDGTSVSQ